MWGTRSAKLVSQLLCQLKNDRNAKAAPRKTGIERRRPGDPACGRMVPQLAQEFIQRPDRMSRAVGSTIPRIPPRKRDDSHFI
jgi:hypothetical protein